MFQTSFFFDFTDGTYACTRVHLGVAETKFILARCDYVLYWRRLCYEIKIPRRLRAGLFFSLILHPLTEDFWPFAYVLTSMRSQHTQS